MDNQRPSLYGFLLKLIIAFTLFVIVLGAFTRLSDAGLGCPDWPGCYGKLVLPHNVSDLTQAQKAFPTIPIETHKAWTEMAHRYCASFLGLLIIALAIGAVIRRRKDKTQPVILPWFLVLFVGFQGMLGMWTVTLKLLPTVVTGHLLGGFTTASLLTWVACRVKNKRPHLPKINAVRFFIILGLLILVAQIFLGAWTSTNYAALVCGHFPYCQGTLFPHMNFSQAFNLFHPIGPNYEGGLLDYTARVTIQMTHRYGAMITGLYWIILTATLMAKKHLRPLKPAALCVLILLLLQITLGILNIALTLPMWTACAHNGVAALLLLAVITLLYRSTHTQKAFT